MEKNKNRTDLLAAGRKKLQQFRQKKDNKGNNSKSSGKAGKPGHDATAVTATEAAVTHQIATDGESSACDVEVTIALSESSSRVDSLARVTAAATDELSAKPGILEFASEFPLKGSEVDETRLSQIADDGHNVDSGPLQKDLVYEDVKYNVPGASDPMILKEKSADSIIRLPINCSSELDRQLGDEQVTDIGAMQEVSNSCGNQIDKDITTQLEGDGNLSSNDLGETAGDIEIADSGNTLAEEEMHLATQLSKTDNASSTGVGVNDAEVAQESHHHSTGPSTESQWMSTVSPVMTGQQREVILSGSSDEEKKEMLHISGGHGIIHTEGSQASPGLVDAETFSEYKTSDSARSLGCRPVDLSSVLDGSVIKLSQLAEILQVLDEDEIRFLSVSRESSLEKFTDNDEVKVNESVVHDAFERLNEHLYVTSVSKDTFHLQLSEHQNLIDEICAINTSLNDVQQKNVVSAEEIVQCRYELQQVASDREELQKQLDYSKAEVQDFAAKVNELQNKLEMAQGGMSSLSSELVDCRNLVEALQSENEQLIGRYKLMTEDKKKLSEENGIILLENENLIGELAQSKASLESLQTLLRDDRVRLEEENDSMLRENSILLVDLVVYKSAVEALEVENKKLNEILTSLSEERKKIEEDKAFVVHQTEQISKEFMDCKDLVVTLQTEISNLNDRLMFITEQRFKVEEEKISIFSEYERQSHELAEIKALVAGLQAEYSKAVDDLQEATFGNNQLTEENEKLVNDLEFHKFKIKEIHQKEHSSQQVEIENDICTLQKPNFDWSSLELLKLDVSDEASGFIALKRNLEDAVIVLQKLEKEIDSMHCYSTSLIRPSDKVAPGVSRLIQAFESKSHADDQDPEEAPSSENQTAEDPYTKTKLVTENLRVRLKALVDDAQNASEFCRLMQSKLLSDAAGTVRSQYDSLREHTDLVEESSIEFMVLYEAMKEHVRHAVPKERELLTFCDVLQKQEVVLKSENCQLREKLNDFQAKISELQSQLDGTCRYSVEMFASISDGVQTLQAQVADRESVLEEEWKFVSDQVLQTIGVLDSTIKTFNLSSLAGEVSNLDFVGRVAASVSDANKVIKDLHGQLEAAQRGRQEISDKHNMALNTLHRLFNELIELVSRTSGYHETRNIVVDDEVLDILHPDIFNTLLDQLQKLFVERSQLVSENKQLSSDLMNRARETDELEKQCLKSDTIMKLVEEIEQSVRLEGIETDANEPASRLESLIYFLVQKYKEADRGLSLSRSLEMQLNDLQGQVEHLNVVLVQTENENLVFKMSLKTAEEDVIALTSKVQEKVAELEQSENRVSSLREKLSIAVTKGKGLISQRDSLKQSLSETSKELEKYSQELQSKDARIHELETKLKVYSEAGERMEALESELSYIRNSATALRESFLLKDSVLQRIEEILEDLELPEHFHSRDTIEKIDWLAKSVGGNSLPLGDWDRRSSVGGGSFSDAGFVGADGLKEDMEPNPSSGDELKWKYEELQNKFYGLAEQNEMLEQSLAERNNLVQRWEEILDRVDMPSQLRSMEPEDKIQWLAAGLSEAQNHCYSVQQKIENLEKFCGSLTADLEDSQRKTSELETAFQQACLEKDVLSRDLEILSRVNDENLKKTADFSTSYENLKDEVRMLQEQKLRIGEDFHRTQNAVTRLQELVSDALQDSGTENVVLGQEGIEHFEEMLRKLVEKYKTLFSVNPVNIDPSDVHVTEKDLSNTSRDSDEQDVVTLSKKVEDSMGEIMCLKEERDRYMLSSQSLLKEVDELEINKKELQDLLNQEEQKSASLREKLNVAVRKGKSLVQQRDGMKHVIEELNAEVERLKSETKHTAIEYEERINNLLTAQERLQVMESENTYLRDRLIETERSLQEKEGTWSSILGALDEIDVGFEFNSVNPFEKLKEIGKCLLDLRTGLDSLEQESRKSKRAAELLLAELNEVQERNDGLQEELTNAVNELSELSREKELAENAKYEALKHVEKLSYLHLEEKDRLFSEIMLLKSGVDNTREDLSAIEREMGDVLAKDLEVLHNVKDMIKSCLESSSTPDVIAPPSGSIPAGVTSRKSETKVFTTEIGSLRERLYNHSNELKEEILRLSEVVTNVHREYASQKELYESMKRDVKKLEMIEIEKQSELHILREDISFLYETCATAISEIENWKDRVDGDTLASRAPETNLKFETHMKGGNAFTNDTRICNEEGIRSMSDKLLLAVRDFISVQSELMEVGQRDMKSTIMNLQKEIQEKDIQRERICMELVNQIKEAETNAKSYLHDLQQAKVQLRDLQRQLDAMAEEREVLEQEIKELQDQTNSTDLQQKVNSLTDALASKVQETEALMQALDEEESEMEHLSDKIGGLENELQQKNKDLENLEVSRAKALKKLSVTVSKFDELHYFSESLLSEVEKLQSQLQERDGEISFLRQEVTHCTNDALAATQMSKKRSSDELLDLLSWLDSSISRVQVHDVAFDDSKNHLANEYKEVLQKRISGLIHELENLRVVTQSSDMILQEERSKVEELARREQYLQNSLHEKESELVILRGATESAKATKSSSEIVEVEQMTNTWAPPGNIAPQVRSLRKTNNDQVAIAIDVDHNGDRLEDDDDDKAHGFKSLTTSKIVPRFTRPVSDMVDGLWVSCDRALMRQPALRLGVIIYWAVLHAMLAIFVV